MDADKRRWEAGMRELEIFTASYFALEGASSLRSRSYYGGVGSEDKEAQLVRRSLSRPEPPVGEGEPKGS